MTDILVKGLTGTPAEVTLFTDANIVNHAAILSGTLLNIAYTKTISNVSSLYFTNRDKSLLGSWPAAGTHVQIPTTYTPTDYAPFVCKPSVLTIGNTVHVLWAYFIKQDGYISTVEIGTGYTGGTLGIESYVSYNGLTYINPTNVLLQSAIDSDAEVDALIAGIPGVNPGEWLVEPQLVEVTISAAAPKGTHHTVNNMVVEYFFSADAGLTWLSEVVIDKVANTNMIYTGTDFVFNTSASDDSGMLYLAISGYNDTTSDNTDYDNFLQVIKGNLNSWSYAKKYSVFNTQGSSAIDAPSLLTYNTNDIDFMLTCVKESASINSNHNLDLMIPDYDNDAPQKYMCINKSIASTFEFPPTEDVPEEIIQPAMPKLRLSGLVRNDYGQRPFMKIAVDSLGNIYSANNEHITSTYNYTDVTARNANYKTIGTTHTELFNGQIVKSGSAPHIWYKVIKKNTSNLRMITLGQAAFQPNTLLDSPSITAAVNAGQLQIVLESSLFPLTNPDAGGTLTKYSPTGEVIWVKKQSELCSWPAGGTPTYNHASTITSVVVDKNDNIWCAVVAGYIIAPIGWAGQVVKLSADGTPLYASLFPNSQKNTIGTVVIKPSAWPSKRCAGAFIVNVTDTLVQIAQKIYDKVVELLGSDVGVSIVGAQVTLPVGWVFDQGLTNAQHNNWAYNTLLYFESYLNSDSTISINSMNAIYSNEAYLQAATTGAHLTTNGDWVAWYNDRRGVSCGPIFCFDVDAALPVVAADSDGGFAGTFYGCHVVLLNAVVDISPQDILIDNTNAVWSTSDTTVELQSEEFHNSRSLYKWQLPTATSTTQYMFSEIFADDTVTHMCPRSNLLCESNQTDFLFSNLVACSYAYADTAPKSVCTDDEYVYVLISNDGYVSCDIYNMAGEFLGNCMIRKPSTRYPITTAGVDIGIGAAVIDDLAKINWSYSHDPFTTLCDKQGSIIINGQWAISTAHILRSCRMSTITFRYSYEFGNEQSVSHPQFAASTFDTTRYVYSGASFETATKKAKIVLVNQGHGGSGPGPTDYNDCVTMIIEQIGTEPFVRGDRVIQHPAASPNPNGTVYTGQAPYKHAIATYLDSQHYIQGDTNYYGRLGIANTAVLHQPTDTVYISDGSNELKKYSSDKKQVEKISILSGCTTNGTLSLRIDSGTKPGAGALFGLEPSTGLQVVSPGTGYSIGDVLELYTSSGTARVSVTSLDVNGGISMTDIRQRDTITVLTPKTVTSSQSITFYDVTSGNVSVGTILNTDTTAQIATKIGAALLLLPLRFSDVIVVDNTVSFTYIIPSPHALPILSFTGNGMTISAATVIQAVQGFDIITHTASNSPVIAGIGTRHYSTLDIQLTTSDNTPASVGAKIVSALNADPAGRFTASGTDIITVYYKQHGKFIPIVVTPNATGVTYTNTMSANSTELYPTVISSSNTLFVKKDTSVVTGKSYSRIQDAVAYAEAHSTINDWWCIQVGAGVWHEDINPGVASTTMKANYLFKAVNTDITIDSSLNTFLCPGMYGITSAAWARTGTDIVITASGHDYIVGQSVNITASTVPASLPIAVHTITAVTANSFTVVGVNTGASSGTCTFNLVGRTQHGRSAITIKESGIVSRNRIMIFEGFNIQANEVEMHGLSYLFTRKHDSAIQSDETLIFNKCYITNSRSNFALPGTVDDIHYLNSLGLGKINNTSAVNNVNVVYNNCMLIHALAGGSTFNPFFTNDTGTLLSNESVNLYLYNTSHNIAYTIYAHTYAQASLQLTTNSSGTSGYGCTGFDIALMNSTAYGAAAQGCTHEPITSVTGMLHHSNQVNGSFNGSNVGAIRPLSGAPWFSSTGQQYLYSPSWVFSTMVNRNFTP